MSSGRESPVEFNGENLSTEPSGSSETNYGASLRPQPGTSYTPALPETGSFYNSFGNLAPEDFSRPCLTIGTNPTTVFTDVAWSGEWKAYKNIRDDPGGGITKPKELPLTSFPLGYDITRSPSTKNILWLPLIINGNLPTQPFTPITNSVGYTTAGYNSQIALLDAWESTVFPTRTIAFPSTGSPATFTPSTVYNYNKFCLALGNTPADTSTQLNWNSWVALLKGSDTSIGIRFILPFTIRNYDRVPAVGKWRLFETNGTTNWTMTQTHELDGLVGEFIVELRCAIEPTPTGTILLTYDGTYADPWFWGVQTIEKITT